MMNIRQQLRGVTVLVLLVTWLGVVVPTRADDKPPAAPVAKEGPKVGLWTWTGSKTGNEHWVHVPENYDPARPCPLMVMSHGVGSSGKGMIAEATCTGAVKRGWIAVAPTWRYDGRQDVDSAEVADEIMDLLKKLVAEYNVDRSTIVSSGFSGGGGVSIKCFTKYPDVFSYLASQSSNFYSVSPPHVKLSGPDRRPVLVVWGENDNPLILDQGPKERDHFTRKGNPTTSYVVPGGKHSTYPTQTWAWLDAIVAARSGEALAEALKAAERLRDPGSEWKVATLLAAFQGRAAAAEKKTADEADAFIKEWDEKYNKVIKASAERATKVADLYTKAVEEGRRQLAEMAPKFTPETKIANQRWVRTFKTRWASSGALCREADAAYEKAYGEKLPEAAKG